MGNKYGLGERYKNVLRVLAQTRHGQVRDMGPTLSLETRPMHTESVKKEDVEFLLFMEMVDDELNMTYKGRVFLETGRVNGENI